MSLCMIVRDEADVLAEALESVALLVDEMIVVDTGSTDATTEIARDHGADVYRIDWEGSFAAARNASIDRATGDWILVLDADERFSPADVDRLRRLVASGAPIAYQCRQWTYDHDPALVGWKENPRTYDAADDYPGFIESLQIRLFPRLDGSIRYRGEVHEEVESSCATHGIPLGLTGIVVHHFGRVRLGERSERKSRLYLELGERKVEREGSARASFELATQLFELGRYARCALMLEELVADEPGDPRIAVMYAKALGRRGEPDRALDVIEHAVRKHPRCSDAWNTLGTLLRESAPRRAEKAFRRALALAPDDATVTGNLAMMCSGAGRFSEARKHLRRARALAPRAARFCLLGVRILLDEGKVEKARVRVAELCESPLRFTPVDVLQLTELGIYTGEMEPLERAIDRLGDVLLRNGELAMETAVDLELNGGYGAAKRLYEAITLRFPDLAPAHNALGCAMAREGDFEAALKKFARAVELEPANPMYLRNTAMACERLGLRTHAARCYATLAGLDPGELDFARSRLEALADDAACPASAE